MYMAGKWERYGSAFSDDDVSRFCLISLRRVCSDVAHM